MVSNYPNPVLDRINFATDEQLVVFGLLGRTVLAKTVQDQQAMVADALCAGIYIYQFKDINGETHTGKFIKQ